MQRIVYYSGNGLNNGNSQWVSNWLYRNRSTSKYIGLGLTVAISVYVLGPTIGGWIFGDKMFGSSSKRSDKFTTGLINNRNDCFANSSIQALSSLVYLTKYLNEVLKQAQFLATLMDINGPTTEEQKQSIDEESVDPIPFGKSHLDEGFSRKRPDLWKAHTSTNTICTLRFQDTMTPKACLSEESSLAGDASDQLEHTDQTEDEDGDDDESLSASKNSENGENDASSAAADCSDSSAEDIPKIPLHESLAQILYQLQQTINAEHHISIWPFLRVIEGIFKAKISTGQNDAHELTQVVLQTLENENLALQKFVKSHSLNVIIPAVPMHGSLADSLFCLSCGESSQVNIHEFTMYSVPVPQLMNADLSKMISDNQTDQISGYSCLCCKLNAILANEKNRNYKDNSEEENQILAELQKLLPNAFINDDLPSNLSTYLNSYDKDAMKASDIKSTIVKKTVVVDSPDILIIHLSRSVFNGMGYQKNTCNVAFDDELVVHRQVIENNKCAGIRHETFKLRSMLRHQGSHSTGHYECYRHKPEFMKDIDTNQVISKTPMVDFGIASNKLAAEIWNQAVNSNKSDSCSIDSEESLSSNAPFRSVFLDSPNSAVVADDDYVIGSSEFPNDPNGNNSSSGVSRTPSTLKRVTGFLSRKGSVSVAENTSNGNGRNDGGNTPTIAGSSEPKTRARFNSVSSMISDRNISLTSSNASNASIDSYSTDQVTNTSATEVDTETDQDAVSLNLNKKTRKRRLKKLKSVVKYPWWRISDTKVKEYKTDDILSESKFVYMLYYEKVFAN